MKKFILGILLLASTISFSQDSYIPTDIKIHDFSLEKKEVKAKRGYSNVSISPSLGLGMIGGGAVFIVAGALTTPTYEGGSTTILKPWYAQPGFYPIASGAALITAGIIISLN